MNVVATDDRRILGAGGERLAAEYLAAHGYRLVMSNFKAPIGRNRRGAIVTGEIDLIALEGGTLCFVEVKMRTSDAIAAPTVAIDRRKQRQIIRTARVYRRIFDLSDMPVRYDAVSIVGRGSHAKVQLFRGFWDSSAFRKRSWVTDPAFEPAAF